MEQHRQPKGDAAMTKLSACLLMASAALVLMPQLGGSEANAVPFSQPALTAGHMHQAQSASRATVREAQTASPGSGHGRPFARSSRIPACPRRVRSLPI